MKSRRQRWILLGSTLALAACGAQTNAPQAISDVADSGVVSKLCAGTSIFGKVGTAVCLPFLDGRLHDLGNPTAKRSFTNFESDADGYGGSVGTLPVNRAAFVDCGLSGSTAARIEDCRSKNGEDASWLASRKSVVNHANWTLITRTGAFNEVWRDERTANVWSGRMGNAQLAGGTGIWCQAAGLGSAQDPAVCNTVSLQPNLTNPRSVCGEGEGRTSALTGENWTTGVYHAAKGKLGMSSTGAQVEWWLPNQEEYFQAYADGMAYVVPKMVGYFATASLVPGTPTASWFPYFLSVSDDVSNTYPDRAYSGSFEWKAFFRYIVSPISVRCIGKTIN